MKTNYLVYLLPTAILFKHMVSIIIFCSAFCIPVMARGWYGNKIEFQELGTISSTTSHACHSQSFIFSYSPLKDGLKSASDMLLSHLKLWWRDCVCFFNLSCQAPCTKAYLKLPASGNCQWHALNLTSYRKQAQTFLWIQKLNYFLVVLR